jgi:hypothetical protein
MSEPKEPEEKKEPDDSWERFGRVVQAALSVPKEEVVKSMEEEKGREERTRKRNRREK